LGNPWRANSISSKEGSGKTTGLCLVEIGLVSMAETSKSLLLELRWNPFFS
jgi:hypothetical protein